jgi:tellurite resistance protein
MSTTDAFKTRARALEDSFFRTVDLALIELIREHSECDEAQQRLRESTGITEELILDDLLRIGVTHSTLVAFLLVPLAEVAWADGRVDKDEKRIVKNTAVALGYSESSAGVQLLDAWLTVRPDGRLFDIWQEYARELSGLLSKTTQREFAKLIVDRANTVANATGGVLGIHKTSAKERKVVEKIKAALSIT